MKIKKEHRKISIENAELIGEGFFSKLYRLDVDTIVKVYRRNTSLDDIERELSLVKQAIKHDIPTVISYDVVDVDDKYGVVFELLNLGTLRDEIAAKPEEFDKQMEEYLKLMTKISTTKIDDIEIPDAKQSIIKASTNLKGRLADSVYNKMISLIKSIPDTGTLIHGDCHIKNVMYVKNGLYDRNELLIIDMDTLSKGNPIFELAQVTCTYRVFWELYGDNDGDFLGVNSQTSLKILDRIYEYYFEGCSRETYDLNVAKIKTLAYFIMLIWLYKNKSEQVDDFEKVVKMLTDIIRDVENLSILSKYVIV